MQLLVSFFTISTLSTGHIEDLVVNVSLITLSLLAVGYIVYFLPFYHTIGNYVRAVAMGIVGAAGVASLVSKFHFVL